MTVRDDEVISFLSAGRNANTQGLKGQLDVLKTLIQAQSRQGLELSDEYLNRADPEDMGGSQFWTEDGGTYPGDATGKERGEGRRGTSGNEMMPPPVSEAQRERASSRVNNRDGGTGTRDTAPDDEMEDIEMQTALERSLERDQRQDDKEKTADKLAFANAKTEALGFTGMGLSNAVRVQTSNNPAGTHSKDLLGTSERIPSLGAVPEFDPQDMDTPGHTSQSFGADGDDAYGPYEEQEWSDGMPPEVAQNAIVKQIWNGYKKASWKWIVENRGDLQFENAIEALLTKRPKAQEMLGSGGKQDKTWLISGEGAPVKWLRDLDWGSHCDSCCAWWMGPSLATKQGRAYPMLGAMCAICERRYEALRDIAMRRTRGIFRAKRRR